jgi:hypothetical protein
VSPANVLSPLHTALIGDVLPPVHQELHILLQASLLEPNLPMTKKDPLAAAISTELVSRRV